ncbi:MAG TPA: TssN family type VI secretion system protein, partial [Niabella sp.]|nr:TssN family type VI secretion system protein [Niabella sp.]
MILKYFLMYAGSFLGLSLVFMTMVKPLSISFANQGKRPMIFNLVASILAAGVAFGTTYLTKDSFTTFWILSGVFLLFGVVFMLVVHKKYFKSRTDNRNKQLFAEILFAVSIVLLSVAVFSSLQYFIKDKDFMFFPIMICGLFFFIPILLLHTFDAAFAI